MKVLMQGRFGLFSASGGDRVQVENTAKELEKLGVNISLSDVFVENLIDFDLVHVFQMDWTAETHFMIKNAKRINKPVVFSPIHHSVDEVKKFDDEYAFDYRRLSRILFKDQHSRDTFKNIYRCFASSKKIIPTFYSLFAGLKNMHIQSLKLADKIIVQTNLEAKDLIKTYNVDIDWVKISNGVSRNFYDISSYVNPLNFDNYILCVGRIEARKNQLRVIEAVRKLREDLQKDIKLVLIGTKNLTHHFEYTIIFNRLVKKFPWVTYIEYVDYNQIPAYFKYAKVCVSASFFETTGLTLLDALFCKTNAVASSPRAAEILGNYASYCDPYDVLTIFTAIKKQYLAPRPILDKGMRTEYTWEKCAAKTYQVYKDLLER